MARAPGWLDTREMRIGLGEGLTVRISGVRIRWWHPSLVRELWPRLRVRPTWLKAPVFAALWAKMIWGAYRGA